MAQKEVEIILSRHLASCLAMPIFLVDPQGVLLYYNEPAERIVGQRFEETGEVPARLWSTVCSPTDEAGHPLPPDSLPLLQALATCRPAHGSFWIQGLDGVQRHIEVVAVPIIGQAERFLGGMALFWEIGQDSFPAAQTEHGSPASASKPVEIILARQLATYLALPIWIFDLQGTLIFYNEPAEPILGTRFDETGEILVTDLPQHFPPTEEDGTPIPPEALPTRKALLERRPARNRFWVAGVDGVRRHIETNAFPLINQAERFLGVIGLLWEMSE
jgi:PAS domain-containing protein